MSKKLYPALLMLLCINQLQAQTGCKDTVFNVSKTNHVCLTQIYGEWKADSVMYSDGVMVPAIYSTVWKFFPGKSFSESWTNKNGSYTGTAKYIFVKGYLEFSSIVTAGSVLLSKHAVKVTMISPTRMVIENISPSQANLYPNMILKKVQ